MSNARSATPALVERLLLDQHERWRRGDRILVETYLQQHAELPAQTEHVLDLIYQEICLRERCGETPALAEYLERFPHLATPLQMQFDLHQAINPKGLFSPADPQEEVRTRIESTPLLAAGRPEIPGYEILAELGRGSMGIVYKARQQDLDRVVALKVIRPGDRTSAAQLARFQIEAEAVAQLQHPNIVQIYAVGEHQGWPYFALELVEGGTLAEQIAGKPQSARAAAALVEQLARAVHFAHQRGIIHRDLKPANILVSFSREPPASVGAALAGGSRLNEEWLPKITDFGLAKRLDRDSRLTRLGDVLGTPQYMAAEQARGRVQEIGPATDTFSLGAILYELLTGRPPIQAASQLAAVLAAGSEKPLPPRQLQARVPRDLEAICLKCLQRKPQARYATADALAEDLHRFLAGEPVQVRPVGVWERGLKWTRRRPTAAALLLVSALALLGFPSTLLIGNWRYTQKLQAERDRAVREQQTAEEQRDLIRQAREEVEAQRDATNRARADAETQRDRAAQLRAEAEAQRNAAAQARAEAETQRDAVTRTREEADRLRAQADHRLQDSRRSLYALQLAQVASCWQHEPARGLELLEDPHCCPVELRDFTWGLFHRCCKRAHVDLPGHKGPVLAVVVSSNGQTLASASADQTVRLWDVPAGKLLHTLAEHTGPVHSLTFTSDGKYLATASSDQTIKVWDVAAGTTVRSLVEAKSPVLSIAFAPGGSMLAMGCKDGSVRFWEVIAGRTSLKLTEGTGKKGQHAPHRGPVHAVAFAPDGKTFASAGEDQAVKLWDVATGLLRATLRGHTQPIHVLAFAPDSKTLASGGDDGTVRLWNTTRAAAQITLKGHLGRVKALAFAAGGQTLASGTANAGPGQKNSVAEVRFWDPTTGQPSISFPHPGGNIHALAFVGDGRQLALAGEAHSLELWDAWQTPELATLRLHTEAVLAVAVVPDGRMVASAGRDKLVQLCETASGRLQRTLSGHAAEVRAVVFLPGGRTLATGSADGAVKLWDTQTGQVLTSLRGSGEPITALAVSPDGALLAAGQADSSVTLWEVRGGKERLRLRGHTAAVTAAAFAPDGQTVASASRDGTVRLWRIATGQLQATLSGHGEAVLSVAFAPDGRKLASGGSDALVKLWDVSTGKERRTLRGHRGAVQAVVFSPDGRTLATAAGPEDPTRIEAPGEVKLWDPIGGQVRATLRGHTEGVTAVAFAPDSRMLATGSFDRTVRWWGAASR